MPKTTISAFFWSAFLGLSIMCLFMAWAIDHSSFLPLVEKAALFSGDSTIVFSMFSAIFAFLCLSLSLNSPIGRPLTLLTIFVATLLLFLSAGFGEPGQNSSDADLIAEVAALLVLLRVFSVTVLPARGDRSGLREAWAAIGLSAIGAGTFLFLDPANAIKAGTICLVFSWPVLIDGINAFADKIFHQAAEAAGAKDLQPSAFADIAKARDIVIDKAAVMSGPDLMVTNVMAFNNEPKTLLAVAASAESGSDHPVAHALRQLAIQWQIDLRDPERFEPADGLGVVALLGGQTVVIGTTDLLRSLKIDSFTADAIARSLEADGKTVLRVAVGGRVVGVLGLEGTLRQDAGVAGMALKAEGLVPWLHSGDSEKTRKALADMLGLETLDDPRPGETAQQAAKRALTDHDPLILTLSQDRSALELRCALKADQGAETEDSPPLATSHTEDIGAFPALKALAMRRLVLAVQARRLLSAFWILSGIIFGAVLASPMAVFLTFLLSLGVLLAFAKASVSDTLASHSQTS